jgi:hypothetical protein
MLIRKLEHESAGLIPAKGEREAAQSPLLDLVSEYVNELTVLGRSADHLRHVDKRLRRLVRECGWTRLADVTPASFQTWRKEQAYKAPKTLNEYLATPHGLPCLADDVYHPAFDHESASALGDGVGAAQRYASDDEDLHGCRATAVARSHGHVAGFW